jgi:hypothetical protein
MPILISQLAIKPALTAALVLYFFIAAADAFLVFANGGGRQVATAILAEPAPVVEPAARSGTASVPSITRG